MKGRYHCDTIGCTNRFDEEDSSYCHECIREHLEEAKTAKMSSLDMVNHPPHYNQGKFEVIDVIEDNLKEGFEDYCTGNVLKYILRYKHKNGTQDLEKALWYLQRAIQYRKEKEDESTLMG